MHPLKKIIHNGPILMKLYKPVLGVRFFRNTVYVLMNLIWPETIATVLGAVSSERRKRIYLSSKVES